jgi:hypothetical protein
MIKGFAFHPVQPLEFLSRLLQRFDPGFLEFGDFDEDRRMVDKNMDKRLILFGENAVFLVQELDDSQSFSIPIVDWCAKQAPGAIPGTFIDLFVEPDVGIGILQVDRFPGPETVSGQSGTGGNPDHLPSHAEGHLGPEFAGFRIVEKESAAIRLYHFAGFPGDLHQHLVQIKIQPDQLPELQQRVKLANFIVLGQLPHVAFADQNLIVMNPSPFSASPAIA